MHLPEWAILVLRSPLFLQIAPFIVLFLVPAVVLLATQFIRGLSLHSLLYTWSRTASMGLDSLGISIPWLWSSLSSQNESSSSGKRHKKSSGRSKTKTVKTRAEQVAMRNLSKQSQPDHEEDAIGIYPGLVNISGTYCFMNSTLQAMASLSYLQPHIDAIHAKAEALDVPTPVIDALQALFTELNTPKSSHHSLRPHEIISVLSGPQPPPPGYQGTYNPSSASSLFTSREHQDAQELFQLVSECIKNEMLSVEREGLKDRGIAGVLDLRKANDALHDGTAGGTLSLPNMNLNNKSVFEGLTANRRSCVVCGYTEAVMHFSFDNWQLALPRLATACRLEDCLEDYTRLEILKDCICRKCSVMATHKRLLQEFQTLKEAIEPSSTISFSQGASNLAESLSLKSSTTMPSSSPTKSKPSNSKKKRFRDVKKMEQQVRTALTEGRIEDEKLLEGVRLEKVVSPASTKQAMIARPPPVLALHLNRSVHYGQYASKNTIRVHYPEILDLTPYTTSGSLSTVPTCSISIPSPPPTSSESSQGSGSSDASGHPRRSTTPTPQTYTSGAQRTIYRLAAVVCHYGQHSFGHYICYRRKPRRVGGMWVPPTLVDPLRLETDGIENGDADTHGAPSSGSDANGNATLAPLEYAGSSTYGETRYYWEDRTEAEMGTGRGWLRISDDSVSECGIETVLAEGSGAFMLYYEKAVHPPPGVYLRGRGASTPSGEQAKINGHGGGRSRSRSTSRGTPLGPEEADKESLVDGDADNFSIGSEETLRPEMKVVDLNGSLGSLVSEVGVGVMKSPKKAKAKAERAKDTNEPGPLSMSTYLPVSSASVASSTSYFGPRIVRSVNARRRNTPETTVPVVKTPITKDDTAHGTAHLNGLVDHGVPVDMTASAPTILLTTGDSPKKSSPNGDAKAYTNAPLGIGSKTTKVMHHHANAKIKAR